MSSDSRIAILNVLLNEHMAVISTNNAPISNVPNTDTLSLKLPSISYAHLLYIPFKKKRVLTRSPMNEADSLQQARSLGVLRQIRSHWLPRRALFTFTFEACLVRLVRLRGSSVPVNNRTTP
jgi:hypothetical protein